MHYVFLAGIGNSNFSHWQRIWHEESEGSTWVEHDDWDTPKLGQWLKTFKQAIKNINEPYVIIAHSLGCLLFTEWASRYSDDNHIASMLVAIPDSKGDNFPAQAENFNNPLPPTNIKPCIIIVSSNDPYGGTDYAQETATNLQAELIEIGSLGHINSDSNLSDWQQGKMLLEDLISLV